MKARARAGLSRIALAAALVAVIAIAGLAAYVGLAPSARSTSKITSSSSPTLTPLSVTVTAVPPLPLISPGETQNYSSIQVAAEGSGLNGTLTVRAFPPSGLSVVLNQTSVPLSEVAQSIPLVLKASPGISPGNYTVTVETSSSTAAASNETFKVQVVQMLIVMKDLAFHPNDTTVSRGTTVTWLNLDTTIGCCDPGYHDVSFLSGPEANTTSPVLKQFYSWSYTFDSDGVVEYYCTIHPFMKAQITVTG